ncbi:hypothetical protein [Burkholderia sp. BDU5]|uniref:hypothetical protein n=1 Tax=Burkholderia sp. BDU5 TaxID=1385590 RepID=UPI000A8D2A56|nr:hypothetical protein [Burkholderia sp. BDU5]
MGDRDGASHAAQMEEMRRTHWLRRLDGIAVSRRRLRIGVGVDIGIGIGIGIGRGGIRARDRRVTAIARRRR